MTRPTQITQLESTDVICGRCKESTRHQGNCIFRSLLQSWVGTYQDAGTKSEKMKITRKIITSMKHDYQARFLRRINCGWEVLSDKDTRDKVSHALRFAVSQRKKAKHGNSGAVVCHSGDGPGVDDTSDMVHSFLKGLVHDAREEVSSSTDFSLDDGALEEDLLATFSSADFSSLLHAAV